MCGEDCPTSLSCVLCCVEEKKRRQVDMILFTEYQDVDLDEDPIIFLHCGHFFTMSTLDAWMQINAAYKQDSSGGFIRIEHLSNIDADSSKPKSCPDCRSAIHSVKRYGRLISAHRLRASERKHMMRVDMKLNILSGSSSAMVVHEDIKKLLPRLESLEKEIKRGPMLIVYQACGGTGVDAPTPPSASFLRFLRLKGIVYGKLVEACGDEAYTTSLDLFSKAIQLAEETQSRRQGAKVILDKTRLILQWSTYSDSTKQHILSDLDWIKTNLRRIDDDIVDEAVKLHQDVLEHFDPKKQIKTVLKAMNIVEGDDYGGSWSDHWYVCPNNHPYFIGECGGAMQESRCIECGAPVGGSSHNLLATNRRAGGAIAEILGD